MMRTFWITQGEYVNIHATTRPPHTPCRRNVSASRLLVPEYGVFRRRSFWYRLGDNFRLETCVALLASCPPGPSVPIENPYRREIPAGGVEAPSPTSGRTRPVPIVEQYTLPGVNRIFESREAAVEYLNSAVKRQNVSCTTTRR